MAAPAIIVRLTAALAKDERVRKIAVALVVFAFIIIMALATLPIMLLTSIVAILSPSGDAVKTDPYYLAMQQVANELSIDNELPVVIAKSVDLILSGDVVLEKSQAVPFVRQHLVGSYEHVTTELIPDPENPEKTIEVERTEIIHYFYSATEMLRLVQDPPYSFKEQDIKAIQEMYLLAEGNGGLGSSFVGKLPMPVNGYVTSGYGNRFDPINGEYFMHPAIDLLPMWHAPVSSIADGTVVSVNISEVYGNNVTIHHVVEGRSIYSFSAHLSRVDVAEGQQVKLGEVIGLEGGDQEHDPNPGRTTGHHLHFEIWEGPNRSGHVNPYRYLKGLLA